MKVSKYVMAALAAVAIALPLGGGYSRHMLTK